MSYKYNQFFYICPRNAVRKKSLSDNYKDGVRYAIYAKPRIVRRCLNIDEWFHTYKYAAPKNAGETVTHKEITHRAAVYGKGHYLLLKRLYPLQRPLYKEDRVEKYRDSIAEYTLPKSFVEEHKYRDIRL
jgi:hypothetical protein